MSKEEVVIFPQLESTSIGLVWYQIILIPAGTGIVAFEKNWYQSTLP